MYNIPKYAQTNSKIKVLGDIYIMKKLEKGNNITQINNRLDDKTFEQAEDYITIGGNDMSKSLFASFKLSLL